VVRVGFLGWGHIATVHSKLLRRSGIEHERAGCYDPDTERARAFARARGHRVVDACRDSGAVRGARVTLEP
jgi:predicted dehydrogenase